MDRHPTTAEISGAAAHTLDAELAYQCLSHISNCEACRDQYAASLNVSARIELLRADFATAAEEPLHHLTDDEIDAIIGATDRAFESRAESHLIICDECAARIAARGVSESSPTEGAIFVAVAEPMQAQLVLTPIGDTVLHGELDITVSLAHAATGRHLTRRSSLRPADGEYVLRLEAIGEGNAVVAVTPHGSPPAGGVVRISEGRVPVALASAEAVNGLDLAALQTYRAYDRLSSYINEQYAASIAQAPFEWLRYHAFGSRDAAIFEECLRGGASLSFFDDVSISVDGHTLNNESFDTYGEGASSVRSLEPIYPGKGAYVTHAVHAPGSGPACWAVMGAPGSGRLDGFRLPVDDMPDGAEIAIRAKLLITDPERGAALGLSRPYLDGEFFMQATPVAVAVELGGVRVLREGPPVASAEPFQWVEVECRYRKRASAFDVWVNGNLAMPNIPLAVHHWWGYAYTHFALWSQGFEGAS